MMSWRERRYMLHACVRKIQNCSLSWEARAGSLSLTPVIPTACHLPSLDTTLLCTIGSPLVHSQSFIPIFLHERLAFPPKCNCLMLSFKTHKANTSTLDILPMLVKRQIFSSSRFSYNCTILSFCMLFRTFGAAILIAIPGLDICLSFKWG